MPVSKLKNLVILILLLANLALLGLLIPSRIAAREQTDSLAQVPERPLREPGCLPLPRRRARHHDPLRPGTG